MVIGCAFGNFDARTAYEPLRVMGDGIFRLRRDGKDAVDGRRNAAEGCGRICFARFAFGCGRFGDGNAGCDAVL